MSNANDFENAKLGSTKQLYPSVNSLQSQHLNTPISTDNKMRRNLTRVLNKELAIVKELGLREKLNKRLESLILAGELVYKNGIYSVPPYDSADGKEHIIDPKELLKEKNLNCLAIEYVQRYGLQSVELGLPLDAIKLMKRLAQTLQELAGRRGYYRYGIHKGDDFIRDEYSILELATINAHKRGVALMLTSGTLEAEDTGKTPQQYSDMKMDDFKSYKGLTDMMLMMKQVFEAIIKRKNVTIPFLRTCILDPNIAIPRYYQQKQIYELLPTVCCDNNYGFANFSTRRLDSSNLDGGILYAVKINQLSNDALT